MSIKSLSTALVLVLAAGAAQAQSINPGVQQLAAQAGVNAGDFTTAQLIDLQNARRDNDAQRVAYILSQAGGETSRAAVAVTTTSPAYGQIESGLRVESGRYTPAELILLEAARADNDPTTVAWILSGGDRTSPATSGSNAGKAQIAAQLGVNPADYTLAQLTTLQSRVDAD